MLAAVSLWIDLMPACIDLSKAHLVRQHGDLIAVYTWVDSERALVILPAYRKKARWFIVKESAAYRYDDPQYMAQRCPEAARFIGLEDCKASWVRLATIINEGLPDLVLMPSEPDWKAQEQARELGVMRVSVEGQTIKEGALLDSVAGAGETGNV